MSLLSALLHRAGKRRAYARMMQLDDHLLRDIGLSRSDLRAAIAAGDIAALSTAHAHA